MSQQKLLIIGAGGMGTGLARAVRDRYDIYFVEPDITKHGSLMKCSGVEGIFANLNQARAYRPFDVAVIATPMKAFESTIQALAEGLNPDCAVTDISSATKSEPWAIARHGFAKPGQAARINFYVPSNPQTGGTAENPNIYAGKPVYLCADHADAAALRRITELWEAAQAKPVKISSVKSHDELAVLTSLWPHVLGFALQLFAAGYDFNKGCENARHNSQIVSIPDMEKLGKTMNVSPEKAERNLTRWERFMRHHHDDIGCILTEMQCGLAEKSYEIPVGTHALNGTIHVMADLTASRIQQWNARQGGNHDDADLTAAPSLQRLFRTADEMLIRGYQSTPAYMEFTAFLGQFASECRDANRALFHVKSAFKLFDGMKTGRAVTIKPPLKSGHEGELQFPA